MLKATAQSDVGPIVLFGLSHANLERLKQGHPIRIDMSEMGGSGCVLIFAGETEASMAAELSDLVGPKTIVTGKTN